MGIELHNDILISVAEKLFFSPDNEFRLDLRDFKTLHFMFINRSCKNSFYFQFRRMKRVYLSSGMLELRSPVPVEGRNPPPEQSPFFQGPFNVNDWLFLMLLQKGILRLKFVETFYALCDRPLASDVGADETPTESLARLLLFKGSPELLDRKALASLPCMESRLDFVKVTDNAGVFSHLDRILNLNSDEVYIESVGAFRDFAPVKLCNVVANSTRHFTLIYNVDINDPVADTRDFSHCHLRSALNAVVYVCRALERVYVRFCLNGEFVDNDFSALSDWLKTTVVTLSTETLRDLQCRCEVIVTFHAFFPESTLLEANQSAHELTQMGEEKKPATDDVVSLHDEDNLSGSLSGDESPASFTIARQLNVDAERLKRISYSLVGVQEDNAQEDWHGFYGPPIIPDVDLEAAWDGFATDDDNENEAIIP